MTSPQSTSNAGDRRASRTRYLELLEKLKVDVVYPFDQTCCGFQGFVLYS